MSDKHKSLLDELDISIVEKLVNNGRKAFNDIAKELNVSYKTLLVKIDEYGIRQGSEG